MRSAIQEVREAPASAAETYVSSLAPPSPALTASPGSATTELSDAAATLSSIRASVAAEDGCAKGQLYIRRDTGHLETYTDLAYMESTQRPEFVNLLRGADSGKLERHAIDSEESSSKRVKLLDMTRGPGGDTTGETGGGRMDGGAASLERRGEGVDAAARAHDVFRDRSGATKWMSNQMDHTTKWITASQPKFPTQSCSSITIAHSTLGPSKKSNSRGLICSAIPFANVIPLGLGPNETDQRLSLSEFVAADIEAVLPGLLNDSELPSFIEFVLSRVLEMLSGGAIPGYILHLKRFSCKALVLASASKKRLRTYGVNAMCATF